ncbi:hypothetical protein M378DRAFT_123284 [Amanita muscaria Koide BX008]|uniref:Uncharacterized protein n=1 Tax=Amanita muscaria (strain Koide BX008) TaxID=946122 RepID=A0A0C2WZ34_AMAMK|nr:hypothetical protein M378DRAFT_123284 [Amanita muscaria Koide BX008]
MLHTLDLSGSSIDRIPFTAAPRLKRLRLRSLPNPTSVSAISWDRLVEVTVQEAQTISMVVEVIQCCPRLESLSLMVKEGDDDGSLTSRSITQHDTLGRLYLDPLPYLSAVTDRLTLPALTHLSLGYKPSKSLPRSRCSQLVAFFTRSNCELQEFTLYGSKFGPGELLECLSHRSCQTLTELAIQGHRYSNPIVDDELLIRLTYPDVDDDVPICPKLRHLGLMDCYRSDRPFPDLLGRMIQSRCFGRAQDAQLRSLRLGWDSISREDYELLQFAQSNGGLEWSQI